MRIDDRRQTDWNYDTSLAPSAPPPPRDAASAVRLELLPESVATRHDPPELLAFFANVRAQATRTTASDAVGAAIADAAREKAVQEKMDAVRDAYSGPYTMKDGSQVKAPPMFHMLTGANAGSAADHHGQLVAALKKAGHSDAEAEHIAARATNGGGSPSEIVAATQALIDADCCPDGADKDRCIREMQWTFGIGADCAGYTYQLLMARTGKGDKCFGLGEVGKEGFRALDGNPNFRRVKPTDVRAGDIITLDGPKGATGHNVTVRAHAHVDEASQREIERKHGGDAKAFFSGAGPFHCIEVDSSWGTGSRAQDWGGYRCDKWFYDEGSKRWGHIDPSTKTFVMDARGPSYDVFHGAYRLKGGA